MQDCKLRNVVLAANRFARTGKSKPGEKHEVEAEKFMHDEITLDDLLRIVGKL